MAILGDLIEPNKTVSEHQIVFNNFTGIERKLVLLWILSLLCRVTRLEYTVYCILLQPESNWPTTKPEQCFSEKSYSNSAGMICSLCITWLYTIINDNIRYTFYVLCSVVSLILYQYTMKAQIPYRLLWWWLHVKLLKSVIYTDNWRDISRLFLQQLVLTVVGPHQIAYYKIVCSRIDIR